MSMLSNKIHASFNFCPISCTIPLNIFFFSFLQSHPIDVPNFSVYNKLERQMLCN